MSKPVFLLDCDGVLADFEERCAEAIGFPIDRTQWQEWDVFSHPAVKEHAGKLHDALNSPGFCAGMKPLPGAVEGVATLREIGSIYIVTSPWRTSPHWASERAHWLDRHFGIKWKQIVSTHAKYLVRGDVLIDDKPEHVVNWMKAHKDGVGVLWNQPYNRSFDTTGTGALRSSSWHHIAKLFNRAMEPTG